MQKSVMDELWGPCSFLKVMDCSSESLNQVRQAILNLLHILHHHCNKKLIHVLFCKMVVISRQHGMFCAEVDSRVGMWNFTWGEKVAKGTKRIKQMWWRNIAICVDRKWHMNIPLSYNSRHHFRMIWLNASHQWWIKYSPCGGQSSFGSGKTIKVLEPCNCGIADANIP